MPVALGLTLLLSLAAPGAEADSHRTLAQAIKLFESFDDAKAAAMFHELLRHAPPRAVAGKAHLYLGLIDINGLDVDGAIEEFKAALLVDPTVELVQSGSPKARLAFDEARHALEGQLRSEPARAVAAPPPNPASVSDTVLNPYDEANAKHGASHALGITLGAVGVAALGVGIYGGVDLLEYNSQVGSATRGSVRYSSGLQSAGSQAAFWAVAWIPFVVAGALGVGAGALTW